MKALLIAVMGLAFCADLAAAPLTLNARSQAIPEGNQKSQYKIVNSTLKWEAKETAIVVCDMWDEHWCKGATRRVGEMAPRMNEVIKTARQQGVLIIHCPSSCTDFYEDTPMRQLARQAPRVDTKIPLQGWCHLDLKKEAPLPIDDSDGGCDCEPQCKNRKAWSRQIASIEIRQGDAVTDSAEAYNLMKQRGVKNVIVMGVHMNMCVLGRPFSIRQMVYQGQNVVLMRDLCDTMYNSRMSPFVSHFAGNRLVTQHIERYWCPTVTSADITGKPEFKFRTDR
jgi:nicotinamidase-related amidase